MRYFAASFAVGILTATPVASQTFDTPEDWTWQLDAEQVLSSGGGLAPGEWWYVGMPPGWHVTTTEQGVVLLPKEQQLEERWAVEVELFLFPNPSDQGFGIVVQEAGGDNQLRFLFRADGMAGLEVHHGAEITMSQPWNADSSVQSFRGEEPRKYILRLSLESGNFVFAVDGRVMLTQPAPGHDHLVVPGLRLGKGLNIHVTRFDLIKPLAPAKPGG